MESRPLLGYTNNYQQGEHVDVIDQTRVCNAEIIKIDHR
jgi:hypothetical protein